jgi:uncharacterized protein YihD (DUF1040 family)
MPTPEELVAYLQRIITTAEHQDELAQVTNPTLVKDLHFQLGQMMLVLIGVRNELKKDVMDLGELKKYADMIDSVLKGEL